MNECVMQFVRYCLHSPYFYAVLLGAIGGLWISWHPYYPLDR